jgi:hypothetical protein
MDLNMTSKVILTSKDQIKELRNNQVFINGIEVEANNIIFIKVTYSGGCKEHIFKLFGFIDNNNKIVLTLQHNSNGDACKKIIKETLSFDLTPIKNEFQKLKDINNNFVTLILKDREIKYNIR